MQANDPFAQMIEMMRRFYPISTAFIIRLKESIHFVDYVDGDIILNYGQIQNNAWFQVYGTSAELSKDPVGKHEVTCWIWFADDFIYTSPGFFSQEPSESQIEIFEDSRFIYISIADFIALKQEFPETEKLTEKIRDHYEKLKQLHLIDLKLTAFRRSKKLYDAHEHLFVQRLRSRLASFLCIDPDTLSRIIKKIKE